MQGSRYILGAALAVIILAGITAMIALDVLGAFRALAARMSAGLDRSVITNKFENFSLKFQDLQAEDESLFAR